MAYHQEVAPKLFAFASILLAIGILYACSSRKAEAGQVQIVKGEPPATSELALMMRQMAAFADSTKVRLSANKDLLPFPEHFNQLNTAEPTPGMKDPHTFDPFARAWLHQLDSLYTTPTANRAEVYNALVQTCAGCHTTMCPGPLTRIKKLSLPPPR